MPLIDGVAHKLFGGHDGPMSAHLGVVLHVNASNGNLDNWVRDQSHQVSCHLQVYKSGAGTQYVDLQYASWCQMSGNPTYISVETEGEPTEPLTAQQVHRIADAYAQIHKLYSIPLVLAEHVGERGFGWHGMGGDAWGGHFGCPGDRRKAQRRQILRLAQDILDGKSPKPPHTKPAKPTKFGDPTESELLSPDRLRKLTLGNAGHLHIHTFGKPGYDRIK